MKTDTELFRLLMRTASVAKRPLHSREEDKEQPLPPRGHKRGYGHILDLLSYEEGLCQQQIASLAGIRPQSVSEAIAALEGRGLVRRETGSEDKRTLLIYLTQAGEEHRLRMGEERARKAEKLFSPLSTEEKEQLFTLLQKIRNAQKEEQ